MKKQSFFHIYNCLVSFFLCVCKKRIKYLEFFNNIKTIKIDSREVEFIQQCI